MKFVTLGCVLWISLARAQTPPASPWEKALAERRWADAEPLLKSALEAEPGSTTVLRGLAIVYRATGRVTDADPLLEKLVTEEETAANVEDLASIKLALGQLARAEALYRQSLDLRQQAAEDDLKSIPTRHRLVQVEIALSHFSDAEQQAQTAVAIRTRKLGGTHPDLAADFALLASVYQGEKKFTEAAATWEWTVGIQETAFGIDDLRLAASLDSLAACRRELHQTAKEEAALRRALAIREVNQGQLNADVAQNIDALARLLFSAKRYTEAEPLYARSLEIWTRLLGPANSVLAMSYDNLAVTQAALHQYAGAEQLYLEAMKLRDEDDVSSLRNLALVRIARENYKDAEPLFKRALAALDAPYNQQAGQLKDLLPDYIDLLRQLGRTAEAARLEARLKALKLPPLRAENR